MSDLRGQAICKDCGNGTLNNAVNEQFTLESFDGDEYVAVCRACGSTHVDGTLYMEVEE